MKKVVTLTGIILTLFVLGLTSVSSDPPDFHASDISIDESTVRAGIDAIDESRAMLRTLVEEEDIVGLAIAVSYEDSLIWSAGFGYSDLDQQSPISPEQTYFRIASLSKPITATVMGRLVEDGIIDLDNSVYDYVPDFPKKKHDFTLRHLAAHRSGIRHYKRFEKENRAPLSLEEGLRKFQRSKLEFEPGTAYLYSSYGYNLLGVAMQNAAQQSFDDLLSEYVTVPLGMGHTIPDDADYADLRTSGFFDFNWRNKLRVAKPVNMYMKLPSGGMLSTAEDLVRFGNAYAYQRILDASTQNEILADVPLPNGDQVGYGLGWGLGTDRAGRSIISHSGGNTGSACRLIVYPEEKFTVAVVSNTFGIDWIKFMRTVNSVSAMILDEAEQQ
ncbi:MAG: serine hydrolase domain-containing protein [Bacteroidota bacterium]